MKKSNILKEETFAGRKFRDISGFWQNRKKFISRILSKSIIRDSLFREFFRNRESFSHEIFKSRQFAEFAEWNTDVIEID